MRNPGVDTVAQLCASLPDRVRADLIDPLCIAALNTPSTQASATVFLRVLADALFGGPGSSDLLLPAAGLSRLFPQPAVAWLDRQGATRAAGPPRADDLAATRTTPGLSTTSPSTPWCSAAAPSRPRRLTASLNPAWSALAASLHYEPIATVYLRRHEHPLPAPMVALRSTAEQPAQFAFDLGLLGPAR